MAGCGFRSLAALVLLAGLVPATARAQGELESERARTLYSLGLRLGHELIGFALSPAELEIVLRGIRDVVNFRQIPVNERAHGEHIEALRAERRPAALALEQEASRAYLARAAAEPGARRTPSGLVLSDLRPGGGASPGLGDRVRVHFHGRLRDGTVFGSTVESGEPIEVALAQMFPCWREGVGGMHVGGKRRLVCPPESAYGEEGTLRVPGGAVLDLEVELLGIVRARGG